MAEIVAFPSKNNTTDSTSKVGNANLPTAEIIKRGQAVLPRLECNLTWGAEWHDLILALGAGRDIALRAAATDKPQDPKYRAAIGPWLHCYGFDCIDKADRSRLLECFDNLGAINAWRASLPAEKQKKLNHPRAILAHWKRSLPPTQSDVDQKPPPGPLGLPAPQITLDAVLTWLAKTASQEDKRRVGAALATDVAAMRRMLPKVSPKATNQQVLKKALGLMVAEPAEGVPAH